VFAVPAGFEPAVSSVTGKHVRPLHHETKFLTHLYLHHPRHALVVKHLNKLVEPETGIEPATV
jgi:hypothetical protein